VPDNQGRRCPGIWAAAPGRAGGAPAAVVSCGASLPTALWYGSSGVTYPGYARCCQAS